MLEKIICLYCNKEICKSKIKRHQNSKTCRNKQQNKDMKIELKEYKCKYCNKCFNRLDQKKEHENNISCNSKDILSILNETKKELELKNKIIKQKDDDINYFKLELQNHKPSINFNNNNTTHVIIKNTININFDDIKNHLDNFNIHILSDHTSLVNFIMNIFFNNVKLTNECRQIISYHLNDKLINDIKCKIFLSNSARKLTEISHKICEDGKNNKSLNDTIVKSACLNNILLNNISSEVGIKNGIRKKNKPTAIILVHEIIKYLKNNSLTEINGV